MSGGLNLKRIEELASEFIAAKAAETLARNARVDVENSIAALIPTEDIGQETVTLPGGQKVTVSRGLLYKADVQAIEECFLAADIPHPPLKSKTTAELDVKGYEWFRCNDPQMFGILSQHVSVTPKKTAITVKAK